MPSNSTRFPFSAVAGQEQFKLALILAAIDPSIGGVLISGPRGCAKSTLARGMADLLTGQDHEFVTLPLGATEEMLVGSMDLQQVLLDKTVAFHPGLLSRAHGGVLYVDEVNLLSDNLVDLLLDVAASGVNCVERDGISHQHDARFILVGTMNPDEGELRPQLKDRFGLMVTLSNQYAINERVEIVRRRERFEHDSSGFIDAFQAEQALLIQSIETARSRLSDVSCGDGYRTRIAERCHAAGVEGLRGDIVWCRAAISHAAWCGRSNVIEDDIDAVQALVLNHRQLHSAVQPPVPPPFTPPSTPKPPPGSTRSSASESQQPPSSKESSVGDWGSMSPQQQRLSDQQEVRLRLLNNELNKAKDQCKGKPRGVNHCIEEDHGRPDWFKTLLHSHAKTSSHKVKTSGQSSDPAWPPELHWKKLKSHEPVLNVILLDTSASVLSHQLFSQAKAVVYAIAEQAYLARERLTVWQFGNQIVEPILPHTRAPTFLREWLNNLPAAGGTPLRQGLLAIEQYLKKTVRQSPDCRVRTYIITDGRSRQSAADIMIPGEVIFIDMEASVIKRGRGPAIAAELEANYIPLSECLWAS